jgi:hypothetical protein
MPRTFLLVSLVLTALLAASYPLSAGADDPPAELASLEFEEIEAGAEEELGEEEGCEEVEEGVEECEEEEAEGRAANARPSQECLLRSASARVVAHVEKNQLKLTIGYTAYESADATIAFGKGPLNLGSTRRHLGRSGVIRLTEGLSTSQTEKLNPGDRISVQLQVAGAPKNCKRVGHLSPRLVLAGS